VPYSTTHCCHDLLHAIVVVQQSLADDNMNKIINVIINNYGVVDLTHLNIVDQFALWLNECT